MARYKMVDGVRIQFTPEEETARDAEESAAQTAREARDVREARIDVLNAKVDDDSITHSELVELTRLKRQ